VLRLTEDQPRFEIERLRGRLPLRGTWTEVVVRQLHRPAFISLGARRIADYLAAELRGQLLARLVAITVYDRIARGRAPKLLQVQAVRYPGQPLPLPETIDTAHGPLRIELYLLGEGTSEPGRVTVSSVGTVVYDDICEFDLVDLRHPPWSSGRVTGMLDFAGFDVTPGTRRGVQPNDAAAAFASAVTHLEESIRSILAHEQERLASQLEADLLKQLQRAFRDLPRLAPEYDFFAVHHEAAQVSTGSGASVESVDQGESGPVGVAEPTAAAYAGGHDQEPPIELFPPGPLATVEIVPPTARVSLLGTRCLRARPRAADGREIRDGVDFVWACSSEHSQIEGDGPRATFRAGEAIETLTVCVVATQADRRTSAEAIVEVVEERPEPAPSAGIPQPEFVNEPTGSWRSRFRDGTWEVNAGHRDYLIASESARRKLRYLTALLAKEIVLHSFPHPQHGSVLERMVEVLTITERRLER
jgi:hypothetical protein